MTNGSPSNTRRYEDLHRIAEKFRVPLPGNFLDESFPYDMEMHATDINFEILRLGSGRHLTTLRHCMSDE